MRRAKLHALAIAVSVAGLIWCYFGAVVAVAAAQSTSADCMGEHSDERRVSRDE
jgi:hypothetical protein